MTHYILATAFFFHFVFVFMFFYFLVRGTYRGHVSSLPDLSNSSTKTFMVKEQH